MATTSLAWTFLAATATTVHKARQTQINHYAAVSRVALLAYDILLNLGREKEFVWDTKFRSSSVLYYMTRYPVVAYQVFNVCYTSSTPNCDAIDKATWAISLVLTRIAISASFILRVYAVMQRNVIGVICVVLLSLIGLLAVVLDIMQDTEASCRQSSNPLSTVLTFITLICFDILATGMLAWRILQIIRDSGGFRKLNSHKMAGLLARSGAIYYVTITALQLGSVILYFLPQGVFSTVLNNYTLLLSSILVSRFLLDLREMIHGSSSDDSNSRSNIGPTTIPSIRYAPNDPFSAQTKQNDASSPSGLFSATRNLSIGLVRDFEDFPAEFEEGSSGMEMTVASSGGHDTMWRGHTNYDQTSSAAWPLEDLVDRARIVEERLGA